jgi:hypothetical protein
MKKLLIAILLFTAPVDSQMQAQPKKNNVGWVRIGEVNASPALENESVLASGNEKFKTIKLHVINKDLNIQNLEIYYTNGEMQEVSIQKLITANTETAEIPLRASLILKKVVFSYKPAAGQTEEAVQVELLGSK